ncbi:hypothetical protein ScPMuIL_008424 [Solemya velum]
MGNVQVQDMAPLRDDERQELDISQTLSYKQYCKHIQGDAAEACLKELPWSIRDSISLYESMNASFNAILQIPDELPLRLPHLSFLDVSYNQITSLPESFGLLLHLKIFNIKHNKLQTLPDSFVNLIKLEKVDLSHNHLQTLPNNLGDLESLAKINFSENKLSTLPLSLCSCKNLSVIITRNNELQDPPQSVCDDGSDATINYMKKRCIAKGLKPAKRKSVLNVFPRLRGNQLSSSVPNPHSAHIQYIQTQTNTTNTPNRIKTPLLPPLGSSDLDADVLKDRIIGLVYGAAIGDAIGLATRGMDKDECKFHYSDQLTYSDIVQDGERIHWKKGDWTSNFDQFVLVLDCILSWAGVVDELDFAKRLHHWSVYGVVDLSDQEVVVLSHTTKMVIQNVGFMRDPHCVARSCLYTLPDESKLPNGHTVYDLVHNDGYGDSIDHQIQQTETDCDTGRICDNGANIRTAVLGIPSFHNIEEVESNALRICKATHADPRCLASSVALSVLVALILQGKEDTCSLKSVEKLIHKATECGRKFLSEIDHMKEYDYFSSQHNLEG